MKSRLLLLLLCASPMPVALAAEGPDFDAAIQKAATDYNRRLDAATRELVELRERIARDRQPLAAAIASAENRVIELETALNRLEANKGQAAANQQRMQGELDGLNRSLAYLVNLGAETVKDLEATLLPGESALFSARTAALKPRLENVTLPGDALATMEAAEISLGRLQLQLGGYSAAGQSLVGADNHLVGGTFAFLGPEVFFRTAAGGAAGVVQQRDGSPHTVTHILPDWDAVQAGKLFRGESGTMLADVTGGRALRLRELSGGLWDTVKKGGWVGYVIVALGAVSLLITLLKLIDIRALQVDEPAAVRVVTEAVRRGAREEAQAAVSALRQTTRELLATGLLHLDSRRAILEEHLEGFVLRQRLHHERRLPLLAVIATAGPLLGLLGTVTGMIKTFTLITVFGTGSAGKLSGGISEALVATELGLAVAIPTLVIHGFLSHRIQKQLAALERYAFEFATAVDESRPDLVAEERMTP